MSSQSNNDGNDKGKGDNRIDPYSAYGGKPTVTASGPEFRFATVGTPREDVHLMSTQGGAKMPPPSSSVNVIDKSFYAAKSTPKAEAAAEAFASSSDPNLWLPKKLRTVPAFYPLEKSSRVVEEPAEDIASRVAECLRLSSVHAVYDNDSATASLHTSENVEMHLSLWKTPVNSKRDGIVVELQRRKGDSILFHRYSRRILDAAIGDTDLLASSEDMDYVMYSKKVERILSMKMVRRDQDEHQNAIIAIEISHSLLTKDRMDARQLGLESLCLLTDPKKTGMLTAILTSHVVLLGSTQGVEIAGIADPSSSDKIMMDESPFQEIRQTILNLVQFSRIGGDEDGSEVDNDMSGDKEHMTLLHNLALAVLANALDVIEGPGQLDADEEEDSKPASRPRLRTSSSNDVANEFMQSSEDLSQNEILATLIGELGKATHSPHNATLSAKCIGSLCRASDEARRKAKELGAKTVVSTALEVGERTHLKLETECKKVVLALERTE